MGDLGGGFLPIAPIYSRKRRTSGLIHVFVKKPRLIVSVRLSVNGERKKFKISASTFNQACHLHKSDLKS